MTTRQPSRRQVLRSTGPVLLFPMLGSAAGALNSLAGVDRVAILPGRTYLRGWAGYGEAPRMNQPARRRGVPAPEPVLPDPPFTAAWSKQSGPGKVIFADAKSITTTATFSRPGEYLLKVTVADAKGGTASSTLRVSVETPPPARQLDAVYTKPFRIDSPLWSARAKALIVNWIPHCIDQINRTDLELGPGGIDNFVEAGKALRGEPHGKHKGYVFSNAWVHQTVESMSIALMIDPQGDREIIGAQEKMRATLDDWIPKILSAQEPDGYLQTAFTLDRVERQRGTSSTEEMKHWERRGDHEGYVAGYFLESAINHYLMTGKKDTRLYLAAKKLADCWCNNIGPAPKKPWYDGHQEMEQALVRFGRFVNDMEGGGSGDRYIQLARFLLDCRYSTARSERERVEYDQSHLPVIEQYEAVGHAVRAVYHYSGMADVAVETHDVDYQSAVKSLWSNIVHRKYYVTGGVGSGETSEGFGPNYSLRNAAYNESCASCGEIFFQWKMHLAYHDAKYVDLYENTMYNALLGSVDLEGRNFYYDNPLDTNVARYGWHTCPCCAGNIPRTLLMFPTWMYSKSADGLYVNMFAGSAITVENVAGSDVEMIQTTDYPWNGKVSITVNPQRPSRFGIHIRVPNRRLSALYRPQPEVNGLASLSVNGAAVKNLAVSNGYVTLTRAWKAGDRIDFVVPMQVQLVRPAPEIEATRGKVAIAYGPLIYNIEQVDQPDLDKPLDPGAPLTTEWKPDLLGGVMVVKGRFKDGGPLMAVPNFARMNRGPAQPTGGPATFDRRQAGRPTSRVWIREG